MPKVAYHHFHIVQQIGLQHGDLCDTDGLFNNANNLSQFT